MPCSVPLCPKCGEYECPGFAGNTACIFPNGKKKSCDVHSKYDQGCTACIDENDPESHINVAKKDAAFDTEGALCDALTVISNHKPSLLVKIDPKIREWWENHKKNERRPR